MKNTYVLPSHFHSYIPPLPRTISVSFVFYDNLAYSRRIAGGGQGPLNVDIMHREVSTCFVSETRMPSEMIPGSFLNTVPGARSVLLYRF